MYIISLLIQHYLKNNNHQIVWFLTHKMILFDILKYLIFLTLSLFCKMLLLWTFLKQPERIKQVKIFTNVLAKSICLCVRRWFFYFTLTEIFVFTPNKRGSAFPFIPSYPSPYLHVHYTHLHILSNILRSQRIWHTLFPFFLCCFFTFQFSRLPSRHYFFSHRIWTIHLFVIFPVMSVTQELLSICSSSTPCDLVTPHVRLFVLVSATRRILLSLR